MGSIEDRPVAKGFAPPLVAKPTAAATAAAVVALHYAGADAQVSARKDDIERLLCADTASTSGDRNIYVSVIRAAVELSGTDCALPSPAPAFGGRAIDKWFYAIASGDLSENSECPAPTGDKALDRIMAVLDVLATREAGREQLARRCAGVDLANEVPAGSVLELYAVVALRIVLKQPIDVPAVERDVEAFWRRSGFGGPDGVSLAATCQAMIVRQMASTGTLIPVICGP